MEPINLVVLLYYLRLLSAFPPGVATVHLPSPVVSILELYPPPSLQPQPRGIYNYICDGPGLLVWEVSFM